MSTTLTAALWNMPDITIVPANVAPSTKGAGTAKRGTSAEAILAGDLVAKDANGLFRKADANDPSAGSPLATPAGIATCSTPGANQTVLYCDDDVEFTLGGTTVPGTPYFLSANPGKICDATDLVAGMKTSLVGFGKAVVAPSTANFIIKIVPSGQTI